MPTEDAKVDCGSCTACCRRELVALTGDDNPDDYPEKEALPKELLQEVLPDFLGFVLPQSPTTGACVYLKDNRCSIYDKRPKMCRVFSCVGWVEKIMAMTTRAERRRDGVMVSTAVWRAGKQRIKTAGIK